MHTSMQIPEGDLEPNQLFLYVVLLMINHSSAYFLNADIQMKESNQLSSLFTINNYPGKIFFLGTN